MKTVFKVLIIGVVAWITMGATGCSKAETSTGADSIRIGDIGDNSNVTIGAPAATDSASSGLPECDGTSATAEAEGRCVAP